MISKSNFKLWSARQGVCRYFIANNKQKTSIILGFCDTRGNQGRGKFYIKLIDLDIWDVAKTFFFNNCLLLASCVICYSINHSPGTWDTSGNTQNAGWRKRVLTLRRRQLEIVIWTTTLRPMVRSIFPLSSPPAPTVFLHHYSVLRVSKAISSYTERKEIERNTWDHTWESNSRSPPTQRANQFRFLGNCPPTPPLTQHFALSEK